MYIDMNLGTVDTPNNQRVKLNAGDAYTLNGATLSTTLEDSDTMIPTAKAVKDALSGLDSSSVVEQNKGQKITFWVGTQEELDAIEDRDDNCVYFTTDSENASGSGLPKVTAEDNGKIVQVVNGEWAVVPMPVALPEVNNYDNGKMLKVVTGEWTVVPDTKVTVIDENSTDDDTPSAKAVYNAISNINLPYSYGTEDIVAGETPLAEGHLYFVIE